MATYKQISGTKVQNFSSDPSTALEGQVWYNSTDTAYRSTVSQTAAWSTGGNLNTGRHSLAGGGTSADASGIGADTSGNGNHFSVVNMGADHVVLDSPTFGS